MMTRQDAKEEVVPMLSHIHDMIPVKKIKWIRGFIDKIYDDIESRTCKHCIHWSSYNKQEWCNLTSLDMTGEDYCSQFEREES